MVKKTVLLFLFCVIFQCCQASFSHASDIPAGRLIDFQGSVAVLPEGKAYWEEAQNGRGLFAGDSVKTGQDSRASILCVDETQLKLNENTVVVLKSSALSARMGIAVPRQEKRPAEVSTKCRREKSGCETKTRKPGSRSIPPQ